MAKGLDLRGWVSVTLEVGLEAVFSLDRHLSNQPHHRASHRRDNEMHPKLKCNEQHEVENRCCRMCIVVLVFSQCGQ